MIYSNPVTWGHPIFHRTKEAETMSQAELDGMERQFEDLLTELTETGELVSGAALGEPRNVKTIRVRGGSTIVTDGPFAETKEQLAGFFVIDCATVERAVEIAARFPDARFSPVELRPWAQ